MTIETVNLPELNWPPGTLARVWFCQPALSLSAQSPYIPVAPASTLALFEAVLALDAALGQPEAGAPSIIIMPELALAPTDVLRVLELMATARANTLLVAGVGQMTQAQVDTIEPDRATLRAFGWKARRYGDAKHSRTKNRWLRDQATVAISRT